jgi:hypothetical protein
MRSIRARRYLGLTVDLVLIEDGPPTTTASRRLVLRFH